MLANVGVRTIRMLQAANPELREDSDVFAMLQQLIAAQCAPAAGPTDDISEAPGAEDVRVAWADVESESCASDTPLEAGKAKKKKRGRKSRAA